ncbi:monofunctional biosynthetic peptidoglycan transglycosylase [Cytophagaceae bacterium ABcell3]|nr:monofunctional biosynthetic peptidoglycan transglycosylase [Cytophagaceae bacterium ABcell3]
MLIVIGFLLSIFFTILFRYVSPPITPLMVLRGWNMWQTDGVYKVDKEWVPLREMSAHLPVAVISSEDQKFLFHYGFDWDAIQKAWQNNSNPNRKHLKGGSTISQQVAKNVFLWPDRTWLRKGFEAYFTLLIEIFWPKERILEVYLNVIETGNGVYGVERISQACFSKSAKHLSKEEAALIVATIPNPRLWSPCTPNFYIHNRKNNILKAMGNVNRVFKYSKSAQNKK